MKKNYFFVGQCNLSDTKVQTEGTPQGSVVSPIFFILKMNKIIAKLPNDNIYQMSI